MFVDNSTVLVPAPSIGHTVKVTTEKNKKEPYPGYMMIGDGSATRLGGASMDTFELFKQLGKPEISLMQFARDEIRKNRNNMEEYENVIVPAKSDEYTPYIKTNLKKHYAHMECLGIIRRIQRGKYMMNPMMFIPSKNVEKAKALWDSLEYGCNDGINSTDDTGGTDA